MFANCSIAFTSNLKSTVQLYLSQAMPHMISHDAFYHQGGVKLSVVCPRQLTSLKQLFEACKGVSDVQVMSDLQHSTSPAHLVLLHGFQLPGKCCDYILSIQARIHVLYHFCELGNNKRSDIV